jgi:hypothetical protein
MTSFSADDRVLVELGQLPAGIPDAARASRTLSVCARRLERRRSMTGRRPSASLESAVIFGFSVLFLAAMVLDLARVYSAR